MTTGSIRKSLAVIAIILAGSVTQRCTTVSEEETGISPVDMVNPHIGGISHMLVPMFPTVQLPNSMVRIHPYTTPGINDNYLASRIFVFPINIPSHRRRPFSTVMITGNVKDVSPESVASTYDHDFETSKPYYYSVLLEDPDVWAEYTVTEHGVFYRFKANKPGKFRLVLRASGEGLYQSEVPGVITGRDHVNGLTQYFHASFNVQDYDVSYFDKDGNLLNSPKSAAPGACTALEFKLGQNETVNLRTGISYISADQSRENFEKETASESFDVLKAKARDRWNEVLGRIKVTGGTDDQQTVFYTSLYRSYERMVNITEYGKYFSIYDGQVHDSEGRDFYVDDWIWDTYRSLHPLRMITFPEMENDMLNSYVRMYEQSGWVPAFPTVFGDGGAMIGHHQAAYFADAWHKGLRNYDEDKAYEGLVKNAIEGTRIPWREGPMSEIDKVYLEKGFFPALKPGEEETEPNVHWFERRQAVAVTLEHAYDDWALSRLSKSLGKDEDAALFAARGQNYRTLFHPETKLVTGKAADGTWIEPYDPKMPAGPGGREFFAESNAYVYSWFAPHDIEGLTDLMGGREAAIQRLDQLYDETPGTAKWKYLGTYPDDTGLTGLFHMGNEPAFHIPYIYNYLGAPWKAQKRLRQLMEAWFRNDVMGVCGDEDGGALSSWFVFSAMGFYPVCPGEPVYMIGSPLFERTDIELQEGKIFSVVANGVSAQNKYIQSAALNGQPLNKSWFTHNDLTGGGMLELEMGPRPNKDWSAQ